MNPRVPTALLAVLLLVLATPGVLSQNAPPMGIGPYSTAYVVYGRIVDANGIPLVNQEYKVSFRDNLEGEEIKSQQPVVGYTKQRGELQADFRVGQVTQFGIVTIETGGKKFEQRLDPELRRSDFVIVLDHVRGPNNPPEDWNGTYSVRVRAVELSPAYEGTLWGVLYARPLASVVVNATIHDQTGAINYYAFTHTLAHGDWNYTFVETKYPVTGGFITVKVRDKEWRIELNETNLKARYSFVGAKFGESTLPASYDKETPQPMWITPFAIAAAAALSVWWIMKRREDPPKPQSPPGPPKAP